jgi:hypothetical protein
LLLELGQYRPGMLIAQILKVLSTSGLRISESYFAETTSRETEKNPDGDRV